MSKLLALDVGDERIGVAISDERAVIARPLEVIRRVAGPASYIRIREIIEAEGVSRVVVGLPLLPDGTRGKQVASTEAYVRGLVRHVDLPIVLWDERHSTQEAGAILLRVDRPSGRTPGIDAIAAAVILQDYMSELTEDAR